MTVDSLLENMPERDKDLLLRRILLKALNTETEIPGEDERFDYPVQNHILDEVHLASYQAQRTQEEIEKITKTPACEKRIMGFVDQVLAERREEIETYTLEDKVRFVLTTGINMAKPMLRELTRETLKGNNPDMTL